MSWQPGMEFVRGLHNLRVRHRGCVATIGVFDGLHVGHQAMLRGVLKHARAHSLPATVVSFEPTPREYFAGERAPARLSKLREKFEALAAFGMDRFVCLRFDAHMRAVSPTRFIDEVLVRGLAVRHLVVGHDFRFARDREGTVDTLREAGRRHGFSVEKIEPFLVDGERVSSSLVRSALAAGDLVRAALLLGRPYRMSGRVVEGEKLGRRLGFPTANLRLHRTVVPLWGVFAVRVHGIETTPLDGVASLGTRPSVNGREPLLEVHVFGFEGKLYGRHLAVDFIARLREERWFPTLDALVEQMRNDAAAARRILAGGQA